ncbi:hypothetical protein [Bosea minatitlanensis]|uniref:Uncharacterized protein n=1 Tax=Bosea minatitlanensis TaxID=128782 RepID=A0ABW0FBB5_9HYPH|nr:hypothetical protein [Bosea minatitlanensis]MCT4495655.1 hypothetical protein [Bosea minatitlanensis]
MLFGNRPGLDMAGLNPIALSASIWRADSGPLYPSGSSLKPYPSGSVLPGALTKRGASSEMNSGTTVPKRSSSTALKIELATQSANWSPGSLFDRALSIREGFTTDQSIWCLLLKYEASRVEILSL